MSRQVSIILIDESDNILLQHRDNISGIWNPGAWGLFVGGVEEGETFEEGLIRETKEELNYDLKKFEFIGEYTHKPPFIVKLYIRRIKDTEKESLKLLEGDDWGWFSLDEANKLDFGVGDVFWRWVKDKLEKKLKKIHIKKSIQSTTEPLEELLEQGERLDFRLDEPQWKNLHIGDYIEYWEDFSGWDKEPSSKSRKVVAQITDIIKASSFQELINKCKKVNYKEEDLEDLFEHLRIYWSEEKEHKIGVLGIYVKLMRV